MAEWLRALFLNHSIISPLCLVLVGAPLDLATCETSQVLLADVPGGFSRFRPSDWPVSYEPKQS